MPAELEDHVPPMDGFESVITLPAQTLSGPIDAVDGSTTVTVFVLLQPTEPTVYVMVVVPSETPVTTPVEEPIVATDGVLLAHVPVPPAVNVIVPTLHTTSGPVIGLGRLLTVNTAVVKQPVTGNV